MGSRSQSAPSVSGCWNAGPRMCYHRQLGRAGMRGRFHRRRYRSSPSWVAVFHENQTEPVAARSLPSRAPSPSGIESLECPRSRKSGSGGRAAIKRRRVTKLSGFDESRKAVYGGHAGVKTTASSAPLSGRLVFEDLGIAARCAIVAGLSPGSALTFRRQRKARSALGVEKSR